MRYKKILKEQQQKLFWEKHLKVINYRRREENYEKQKYANNREDKMNKVIKKPSILKIKPNKKKYKFFLDVLN